MTLTFAAALAAAAFTAAPAVAAPEEPPCDPGPCLEDVVAEKVADTLADLKDTTVPTVDDVIWAVRCIGDSLGGNACHS